MLARPGSRGRPTGRRHRSQLAPPFEHARQVAQRAGDADADRALRRPEQLADLDIWTMLDDAHLEDPSRLAGQLGQRRAQDREEPLEVGELLDALVLDL